MSINMMKIKSIEKTKVVDNCYSEFYFAVLLLNEKKYRRAAFLPRPPPRVLK